MLKIYPTREAWLLAAVEELRPFFAAIDRDLPERIRVSTGWSKGARKAGVGWCWKSSAAEDDSSSIFISPELAEPLVILAVLLHEMSHAANDCRDAHGGDFRRMWAAHGFIGKPTMSVPSEALTAKLVLVEQYLGAYPHAKLSPQASIKPQTTRMIKVEAPCCGYIVRTTQRWLDRGLPSCPCGTQMEVVA